jgi:RND superfamily putative drug exporter
LGRGSRGRDDSANEEREARPRIPLTLRRPKAALVVAGVLVAVLVGFSFSLEEKLTPSTIDIPETSASRANDLLKDHFGPAAPFAILLQGPEAALDRQGPALIRTLRRDPLVTTVSPWDRGNVSALRPSPRRALLIADFHVGINEAVDEKVGLLNRTLEKQIRPPVTATQTSFATLNKEIEDESIHAVKRAEMIAMPILLIVLLLVFRSPIAAAVPLAFGAISVFSSQGLLSLLTNWFDVSALALVVCTMMGLALGVDYALLLVSRFREELASGAEPVDAAWATRRTAGRTTIFAGSTLVLSMMVAFFIVPGALLASLAATLALVVVLTVLVATFAGPPILVLLGTNVNRWQLGAAPGEGSSRLMALVTAALRRPAPVAAAIGLVVLILAAPALALKTGPFSVGQLPEDNQARQDAELIMEVGAPGFEAPFTIVVAADRGTITEPDRLAALTRWQRRIANQPGVEAVIGPGQVSRAVRPLRKIGSGILASGTDSGPLAGFGRLGKQLGVAADGVVTLRGGISQATYGASLLAEGSGATEEGARLLASGLSQATAGGDQLVEAIDTLAKGSRQLAEAQERAVVGSIALKLSIPGIRQGLRGNGLRKSRIVQKALNQEAHVKSPELQGAAQATDAQVKNALALIEGMTVGKADPNYGPALEAIRQASGTAAGLPVELAAQQARLLEDVDEVEEVSSWIVTALIQLKQLESGAKRLTDALREIQNGSRKLAGGAELLDRRVSPLSEQLDEAADGATRLAGALAQLNGGITALERGLGEGYRQSYPLQTGLRRATVQVVTANARLGRQVGRLRRTTPGIFDSGYFVLSALDGARPELRELASGAIDLDRGGQAATLLVISRFPFNSDGSIELDKRLKGDAIALARDTDSTTAVAGGPPTLNTYSKVTRARIPLVVAAITLATFLVLVLVLRAIPLAALAVGLNLATVGVAFGILMLLTEVPDSWPLGGREYVDAVGTTMIFGVVFGLSIDYAVFLLVRMRERYDVTGDHADAIAFGLEKTARVITGAAAIMMAVFIAFAGASIATVSQLGIGLTVAVILDATVVRIVLLPALMLLIGERVWWLPRPLQRALPRLNV